MVSHDQATEGRPASTPAGHTGCQRGAGPAGPSAYILGMAELNPSERAENARKRLMPPWRWIARRRYQRIGAERDWLDTQLNAEIAPEALAVASQAVNRELASLEALNNRLLATITFAGALLTLAISLGQKASGVFPHHHDRRVIFEIGFVAAVVLLALAVLVAIWALRPAPRHRMNPELLKHYGTTGTGGDEINQDTYRWEVALVVQLGYGNNRRARAVARSQRLVAIALVFAAALAVILLLGS
jgi:MFS family permease